MLSSHHQHSPAAVAHYELGAKLLRCPRIVAVLRLRHHHLVLVHFAAHVRWRIAAIRRRHAVAVMLDRQLALQLGAGSAEEGALLAGGIGDEAQHIAERQARRSGLLLLLNHLRIVVWRWRDIQKQEKEKIALREVNDSVCVFARCCCAGFVWWCVVAVYTYRCCVDNDKIWVCLIYLCMVHSQRDPQRIVLEPLAITT